jgi:hypothetical protein
VSDEFIPEAILERASDEILLVQPEKLKAIFTIDPFRAGQANEFPEAYQENY